MNKEIKAAVIGASGYTGLELLQILNRHRVIEVKLVTSGNFSGKAVNDVFPALNNIKLDYVSTGAVKEGNLSGIDVVFLCLPSLESMAFVKKHLMKYKGAVIDIGSDFRIKDADDFRNWYKEEHQLKKMLGEFVYGLPEINAEKIKSSRYIANPGCYPTSVLLALAPLIDKGSDRYFEITDINIDSKSGVSGAGRKLKDQYLFCSINENFYAYSPVLHRHIAEIEQEIKNISGKEMRVCFTPHLLPVDRGIFSTIYCRPVLSGGGKTGIFTGKKRAADRNYGKQKQGIQDKAVYVARAVSEMFAQYYKNSYFVRFTGEKIPQIKDVCGTNCCLIGFAYDERTDMLKLFSVIDNLVKGAAGQAVQNMNIIFGIDQQEGLDV
ncbi:MAG: N-acetyl-gamma-glutamyl-phosphate reductase [Actinobacteria bacterium]|nr:N-acetyl-gamma-glutamyl-phosphate reductase [Actinomycetota bacterium]